MQHINCINTTKNKSYSQTVNIGTNSLTVEFSGEVLPSGIYPRRFFSYLCKQIIRTRSKAPIVNVPRSRAQFYKEALGVHYVPSSKDIDAINLQIKAFIDCKLSLSYSNPNDKSRKQREQISFVSGDHSWLYDDSQIWKQQISLSDELFELIKLTAVPISAKATEEFSNARKLDILNYLLYQNYNLHLKGISFTFQIEKLYELFGGGVPNLNEFRRVLNKVILEIKELVPLDIEAKDKYNYVMTPTEKALLKQHKRRKTNQFKDQKLIINEDFKDKLKQSYSEIDIESACVYVSKRNQQGEIRHPYAYLRDVLKNPSWYQTEKIQFINNVHKIQLNEYEHLSSDLKSLNARHFIDRIQKINIYSIPRELQPYHQEIKQPGQAIIKGLPGHQYRCYMYWAFMHNKCTEFNSTVESNLIKLFKLL